MNHASVIIAVIISSSVAVMLTSGGKYERITTSVACAAIALSALVPAAEFISTDIALPIEEYAAELEAENGSKLIEACRLDLEERVLAAVSERFRDTQVENVSIEIDSTDPENVRVTKCTVTVCGAYDDGLSEFLSENLCCENIQILMKGGG